MESTDQKLTGLKKSIKEWNENVFGDIEEKLKAVQSELKKLDAIGSIQDLNGKCSAASKEEALEGQQWLWLERKERLWRQLSRCKNLKEGDKNTKYFHAKASLRRNTNSISCLLVNGRTITNLADIKKSLVSFYKALYSSKGPISVDLSSLNLKVLFDVHRQSLEASVSIEEIKAAVWGCNPSKAPGYDGFNIKFVISMWDVIGNDVISFVQDFFSIGSLPPRVNTTWITLIPKRSGAMEIGDFRPISMVDCLYKIISKVLTNRLKVVMPILVGETQTAFIAGRQIVDSALIANEVITWLRKIKKSGVLLKVDFQKAYDMVEWHFLDYVLQQMGLSSIWRAWINSCLATASILVLVNGTPTSPFPMQRGLRQGDPLSPFIFVLVVEVLSRLLHTASSGGFFRGLKVG